MKDIELYRFRLKEERKRKNWTQEKTSKEIGISRSHYSDIENGRTVPSGKTIFLINEVFPIFLFSNDVNCVEKEAN